jgi:pimeloyl-ACP methyl ester carboxylesterase
MMTDNKRSTPRALSGQKIEHATVAVGGVALHVVQAGPADGPLLFLLHGFPEFWYAWRSYIGPFADVGFRVVVPDQRGYNLSGRPVGVDAYRLDRLAQDIFDLADAFGRETFQVVGHDWGASVAWWMATRRPARLLRMAALNAPHPAVWRSAIAEDPEQRKKSRYVQMLRLPWLPELMIRAGGYSGLAKAFETARPGTFAPDILAEYQAAWRQPGALTAMLNWYRALFRQDLPAPGAASLTTPTLVLWGDRDPFAGPELAEKSAALCVDPQVVHFPDAGHWLPHDEPAAVQAQLLRFLRR